LPVAGNWQLGTGNGMKNPEYLVIITGLSGSALQFILRRAAPKDLRWQ